MILVAKHNVYKSEEYSTYTLSIYSEQALDNINYCPSFPIYPSLHHSLPPSLLHSLTHSLTHSLPSSFTHSHTHSLPSSPSPSHPPPLPHSLPSPLPHSLPPPLPHSLPRPLTRSTTAGSLMTWCLLWIERLTYSLED